jgi:hypothetical protein
MTMVRQLAALLAVSIALATLGTMTAPGSPTAAGGSPGESVAPGGSLIYVVGSNVWLAAPDGSGAHQLTTDGSQQAPYRSPIQAPDGSILVLHGPSEVDHLDRDGKPIGSPITLNALENGVEALAISPDGTHIAYVTTGFGQTIDPRFGTPNGTYIYGGTDVAGLDGVSVAGAAVPAMIYPSWLDDETLAGSNGTDLWIDTIGGSPQTWLSLADGCLIPDGCPSETGSAANLSLPIVSRDATRLAYQYDPFYGDGGRRIATIDGVGAPPMTDCLLPETGGEPQDTGTFAPDGSAFAWDDTTIDASTFTVNPGQGIWMLVLQTTAADCGGSTARLVIPGGSQPDWGPMAP